MKAILCPCEDLTLREVEDAVKEGYDTLEDIKRYTGLATGTCQGRLCLAPCVEVLARLTGRPAQEVGLIRFRAPVEPVPLGVLAAGSTAEPTREED